MNKSTINAACQSIMIIIDENKKLLAISESLMKQNLIIENIKLFTWIEFSNTHLGKLVEELNKKSLTIA